MNSTQVPTDLRNPTVPSTMPPPAQSTLLTTAEGDPSLGQLVMGLTDDITTLVRKEVELAKAELQESIQVGAKAGGMVAAGGAVAYAGLLFILAAIAIILGDWWNNYWLGAAVVGIIAGIVGYVMLQGGIKQLKQISIVPHKTISSLQSDAEMAKEKLS
jgi:uncharacterized membrane protein YqjE